MVYERGEDDFIGARRVPTVVDAFAGEVTTVRNFFDHQYGYGLLGACPGCSGAATELE